MGESGESSQRISKVFELGLLNLKLYPRAKIDTVLPCAHGLLELEKTDREILGVYSMVMREEVGQVLAT